MRLFAALELPRPASADLDRFLDPRRDADTPWRWTPPANWHVTLAFLGDVDPDRYERLVDALADAAARSEPLELRLRGAGAFGKLTAAKHLYLAVVDPGGLTPLAEHVKTAAGRAGCRLTAERYVPHVTVARTSPGRDATSMLRVLDTYEGPTWRCADVGLYRSTLGAGPGGHPRYDRLESFDLRR